MNNFATILTNVNFNATKKTVVWLYGLSQLPSTPEVQLVVDAYQQNGNYNFIQVSMPMIRYVFSVRFSSYFYMFSLIKFELFIECSNNW